VVEVVMSAVTNTSAAPATLPIIEALIAAVSASVFFAVFMGSNLSW
jgi:hypothetical protein